MNTDVGISCMRVGFNYAEIKQIVTVGELIFCYEKFKAFHVKTDDDDTEETNEKLQDVLKNDVLFSMMVHLVLGSTFTITLNAP